MFKDLAVVTLVRVQVIHACKGHVVFNAAQDVTVGIERVAVAPVDARVAVAPNSACLAPLLTALEVYLAAQVLLVGGHYTRDGSGHGGLLNEGWLFDLGWVLVFSRQIHLCMYSIA